MTKYLLLSEQEKINELIELLALKLNQDPNNLNNIKENLTTIIKENKDSNIEDTLNTYSNYLEKEIKSLLTEKYTPGIQVGLQNNNFKIVEYGGRFNGTSIKEIKKDTLFSFDSISKILISLIITEEIRNNRLDWNTKVNEYNKDFELDATIESIIKFTSLIRTEKRIDNLETKETIDILKRCKELLNEKEQYKSFYEYSDIGYMILRLSIPEFLTKLDNLLSKIDNKNLSYDWINNKKNITGGKIESEYITPDPKGKKIFFPGHTGLYGNIEGLLNLFEKTFYEETIISKEEKEYLLKQPYQDPIVYSKDGTQLLGKNQSPQYMAKIAGIYRKPTGITDLNYNKLASCDMSYLTTDKAIASTGTCGSWAVTDNLSYQDKFGHYTGGLLTNPYSYVEHGYYPEAKNNIPNTNLTVNQKGIILGYQAKLNPYKELITEYGLLLELLTQYLKETDKEYLSNKKYQLTKKIS